jgi:DNA replication protein DnaC
MYYCPKCDEENIAAIEAKVAEERHNRLCRGVPPRYHDADLRQFDAASIAPILKWAENPTGFLFVNGPVGTGKTHAACAVQKRLNAAGRHSTLVFSAEMFQELHKSFGKQSNKDEGSIVDQYAKGIAIFDDVGVQKTSDYTTDAWYKIIDQRYRYNIPTMFTTNHTVGELAEKLGVRTASRIASGVRLTFGGDDRRVIKNPHWTIKAFD